MNKWRRRFSFRVSTDLGPDTRSWRDFWIDVLAKGVFGLVLGFVLGCAGLCSGGKRGQNADRVLEMTKAGMITWLMVFALGGALLGVLSELGPIRQWLASRRAADDDNKPDQPTHLED